MAIFNHEFLNRLDAVTIPPEEAIQLLNSYHAIMAADHPFVMDESALPGGKAKLKTALIMAMVTARTREALEHWKVGYLFLATFLPGVGPVSANKDETTLFLKWSDSWHREHDRCKRELQTIDVELKRIGCPKY